MALAVSPVGSCRTHSIVHQEGDCVHTSGTARFQAAHRKLQSEIGKLLAQTEHVPDGAVAELNRELHRYFGAHFQASVEDPELGRKYMDEVFEPLSDRLKLQRDAGANAAAAADEANAVARELAVTVFLQAPQPTSASSSNHSRPCSSGCLRWCACGRRSFTCRGAS